MRNFLRWTLAISIALCPSQAATFDAELERDLAQLRDWRGSSRS